MWTSLRVKNPRGLSQRGTPKTWGGFLLDVGQVPTWCSYYSKQQEKSPRLRARRRGKEVFRNTPGDSAFLTKAVTEGNLANQSLTWLAWGKEAPPLQPTLAILAFLRGEESGEVLTRLTVQGCRLP